ncbi:MAG: hypothetical protein H8F28_07720 [Fibrella sp.]|nr:hypothetical protein [Armatimonadota bacterium]
MATTASHSSGGGHGHGTNTRLHEDLPHYKEFHITHPPTSLFHLTGVAIAGLLVLTVVLYYIDLSKIFPINGINLIVALMVATFKAYLVIRNFMNLKGSTPLTVLWAALGFIWLLLMGGIFLDYRTRPESPGWQKMEYTAENASPNTVKKIAPEQTQSNP